MRPTGDMRCEFACQAAEQRLHLMRPQSAQTARPGAESSLTQPQMVVMSDTDDPFVPLPDDLLVNLAESRGVVESLLDSLPTTFSGNSQVLPAPTGLTSAWSIAVSAVAIVLMVQKKPCRTQMMSM